MQDNHLLTANNQQPTTKSHVELEDELIFYVDLPLWISQYLALTIGKYVAYHKTISAWQIAEEPRALSNVVKGALRRGDSDTDSLEGEESSNKETFGRKAQERVMEKVAHKMASIESRDCDNEVIPKVHEFEELLYIYCAKPSEMEERHVKGGPLLAGEHALMANLSEPQLGDLIKKHPNSLIE